MIIDAAIKDNRRWEQLCFGLVILLVGTGVSTLVTGIIKEKDAVAVSGAGVTGLFWPALSFARRLREFNIRIRLSEVALSLATTPEEAANVVERAFVPSGSRQEVKP